VDPATTDEERAAWDVPSLAEQLHKAEETNRLKTRMTEKELQEFQADAPDWVTAILKKWSSAADTANKNSDQ